MALSKFLQALSTLALFVLLVNKAHSQDVTTFTVDRFSPNPTTLTYQGDAHVPQGTQFLRLTKTDNSGNIPGSWSVGRVLYSKPVHFWDSSPRQSTFETTINFVIRPSSNGAADGIVFFIAPVGTTIPSGSGGANLGVFGSSGNASNLFAVEFDTWINDDWDPNYRHIGIDINSRMSRNVTEFDSATGQLVTARINYDANTKIINVVATSGSQSASLRYVFNLRTILPDWVQVGISSATGGVTSELAVHDIRSWYFTSTLVRTNLNDDSKNEEAYIQQVI